MNETPSTPGENLPGSEPAKITLTPVTLPETVVQSSIFPPGQSGVIQGSTKEKKKWKEYLFEFLLVFAAVFMGFWADSFREHLGEKNKESEYMESMVADLKNDSVLMIDRSGSILDQIYKIDELQELFSSNLVNGSDQVKRCYELSGYIAEYYTVPFNKQTITQLTSTGNMRLIKSKEVSDSILGYYNALENSEHQLKFYTDGIRQSLDFMYNIYDVQYLRTTFTADSFKRVHPNGNFLLTTDPVQLKKLIAILEGIKISANYFLLQVDEIYNKNLALMRLTRKKYDIKE